jgi:hypothetical protein
MKDEDLVKKNLVVARPARLEWVLRLVPEEGQGASEDLGGEFLLRVVLLFKLLRADLLIVIHGATRRE